MRAPDAVRTGFQQLLGAILLLACAACGGGGGGSAPPPAPSIASFTAAKSTLTAGTGTALTATFQNGSGSIDHGVGAVTSGAPVNISPAATTTYTLTVSGNGTATRAVTVNVVPPAAIISFGGAQPILTLGASENLTVVFTGGSGSIDQGVGTVTSGTPLTISPAADTTYTLTVTNAAGDSVTGSFSVQVVPAPIITAFAAAKGAITAGTSTTLTAVFSGGSGSVDQGVGPVASGVPVNVAPSGSTSYTLTVTNAAGTFATQTLPLPVVPAATISAFTGAPGIISNGQSSTLSWTASGAASLSIDQGVGTVTGSSQAVSPGSTTVYTLKAFNALGDSISASTTITVDTLAVFRQMQVFPGEGNIQASLPPVPGASYLWSLTAGTSSATVIGSSTDQVLSYLSGANAGTYQLDATLQDTSGHSLSRTLTLQVVTNQFLKDPHSPGLHALHPAILLPDGRVLFMDGTPECYDPYTNTWSGITGQSLTADSGTMPVLLANGKVLFVGRAAPPTGSSPAAALYDPASDTWSPASTPLYSHPSSTATRLLDGRVLLAGGTATGSASSVHAEVYDPAADTWADAGTMAVSRAFHAATLLEDGQVLVSGGSSNTSDPTWTLQTAERYDPASNQWAGAGSMAIARVKHTATLLASGKVLVAGGTDGNGCLASCEIYNPASNSWSGAAPLLIGRTLHTATLLQDGQVLVIGGVNSQGGASPSAALQETERYDPILDAWTAQEAPLLPRAQHAATLMPDGKVLVVGGGPNANPLGPSGFSMGKPESYDPSTGHWSSLGDMVAIRAHHTATLLPNGDLLVVGGVDSQFTTPAATASSEMYRNATGAWSGTGAMQTARAFHTATLLQDGRVLVVGGASDGSLSTVLASAEIYDPAARTWSSGGILSTARANHTATLLPDGKVLVAGGQGINGSALASAELYDPATNSWSPLRSMLRARVSHAAALLPDGRVLVEGGVATDSLGEVYDPATGAWTATASMVGPRFYSALQVLGNGKAVAVGGIPYAITSGTNLASAESFDAYTAAEQYDSTTNQWVQLAPMHARDFAVSACLLGSGKLFVVGAASMAQVYDPITNTWATQGALGGESPIWNTATLLPSGKVIVTGGFSPPSSKQGIAPTEFWKP